MRKRFPISIDLYGMSGTGATKADAKADAAQRLTAATTGSYFPEMYRFPSHYIGIVYRDLYGWNYGIMKPDSSICDVSCVSGCRTKDEAERHLRVHIAQNLISTEPDNGLSVLLDNLDRTDHIAYIAWQERYAAYKAQGYTDQECHRMACEGRTFCPAV